MDGVVGLREVVDADPERPPAPVDVDWDVVEEWLGLRLPADYKQLAATHGPVDVGEYLWIHVPCGQEGRFDYGTWLQDVRRRHRVAGGDGPGREEPGQAEQPVLHPDPGGLLAFGESRGGDVLFWDTSVSADPDEWTVVVRHVGAVPESGLQPWHRYDLDLTGYLRHTVRADGDVPDPPGPLLGPLNATVARTGFLAAAHPWSPPGPVPPRLTGEERRVALETGTGPAALRLLCPPPRHPYLGGGTWRDLYEELRVPRLPAEYVSLMETYGAGCWSGWLRFLTVPRQCPGAASDATSWNCALPERCWMRWSPAFAVARSGHVYRVHAP